LTINLRNKPGQMSSDTTTPGTGLYLFLFVSVDLDILILNEWTDHRKQGHSDNYGPHPSVTIGRGPMCDSRLCEIWGRRELDEYLARDTAKVSQREFMW
jgi:hypothetical protein